MNSNQNMFQFRLIRWEIVKKKKTNKGWIIIKLFYVCRKCFYHLVGSKCQIWQQLSINLMTIKLNLNYFM